MNSNPDDAAKSNAPTPAFDPIDAALRQLFDEVSEEEVPEDFSALVAQFAQRKSERGEK